MRLRPTRLPRRRQAHDGLGARSVFNRLPSFVHGDVHVTDYDGNADDLLTAGLGKTGLAGALPAFANPLAPTAAELRRAAIYNNYRAIVDMTAAGGYGTLYGPNVDCRRHVTAGEGKIAGTEYLAFSRRRQRRAQNVVLLVQVPASFDPASAVHRHRHLVGLARRVRRDQHRRMGAEARLRRGLHRQGHRQRAARPDERHRAADRRHAHHRRAAPATCAQFRAPVGDAERAAFNAATPNRFAFKHAHSQRNPEKDWGRFTLQAVEFAFWALNDRFGIALPHRPALRTIRPRQHAGHRVEHLQRRRRGDRRGRAGRERLIDGVAVSEPAVELPARRGIAIRRGARAAADGRQAAVRLHHLRQPVPDCAALSPQVAGAPGRPFVVGRLRGQPLRIAEGQGPADRRHARGAGRRGAGALRDYGWEPESAVLHASLAAFEVAPAVSVTFANALRVPA